MDGPKPQKEESTSALSFGYGRHGQLGHGITASTSSPSVIKCLEGRMISQVACGGAFCAALSAFGFVYTWGDLRGALPTQESHLRGIHVTKIACSAMQTFALTTQGKVYHWGEVPPKPGELDPTKKAILSTPSLLAGDTTNLVIKDVAAGALHALLLSDQGQVYSLGENYSGQLGLLFVDKKSRALQPQHVKALESSEIIQIACGGSHSLALSKDGKLFSWGSNQHGQLGIPLTNAETQVPFEIKWVNKIPSKIISIVGGDYHNLMLCEDGSLYGWGKGTKGQLGIGNFDSFFEAVEIFGFDSPVVKIAAGGGLRNSHSMAITKKGTLYCWGSGGSGQLGTGTTESQTIPTRIPMPSGLPVIDAACGWTHSLVLSGTLPSHLLELAAPSQGDLGLFDLLPNDLINVILRILRPREVCRLATCSKFFNHLSAEPTLWLMFYITNFPFNVIGNCDSIHWKTKYVAELQKSDKSISSLEQLQQHKAKQVRAPPGIFDTLATAVGDFFAPPKPMKLIIFGLDASGKTTILYMLKLGEIVSTIPTIGFNVETIKYSKTNFTMWDVGGGGMFLPYS